MKTTKINIYVRSALAAMICLIFLGFTSAHAKVTGQCANCHTMHNSQDGGNQMINPGIDGTDPKPALTRGSCVGCHTGDPAADSVTPFVNTATAPTTALAGGNFYWATQDGKKGHNVKGVPGMEADLKLTDAPGNSVVMTGCTTDNCHNSLFKATEVATGCEGCHLAPAHHATQQATGTPALAANGYFRFLSECPNSGTASSRGVVGIEDDDWQYSKSNTDHNEYLGNAAGDKTDKGGMAENGNTMTGYCTGCHGNFHVQDDGNSNWIRHPSDAVIPNSGEYQYYTAYDPDVPIARPTLTAVSDAVTPGTDMVMCLSCHKAHGSEHDDMLRWDYTTMKAGGGENGNGCFKCHTEKDT